MTIIIFLAILVMLVLVHELGHFIAAKKTGMRVDEFGIGFPPKLFGIRRGETEYTFNALPIGGFVKIFGEDAVDAEHAPDRGRSFVAKNKWQQAIVLVAGVTMNVLFAWLLFSIALGLGVKGAVTEEEATPDAKLIVSSVLPESPAAVAGFTGGAHIISIQSGSEVLEKPVPSTFSAFVNSHRESHLLVTYSYQGRESTIEVKPTVDIIGDDPDRAAIGVALTLVDTIAYAPHEAVYEGLLLTFFDLSQIIIGLWGLLLDALTLNADLSQIAGPVGIVNLVGEASSFGLSSLLMFTAFISLNLAVINLLPFPALDGGRLLFVLIEAVKGTPIQPRYVHALNTIGFFLLILLMIAVTFSDLNKIF